MKTRFRKIKLPDLGEVYQCTNCMKCLKVSDESILSWNHCPICGERIARDVDEMIESAKAEAVDEFIDLLDQESSLGLITMPLVRALRDAL